MLLFEDRKMTINVYNLVADQFGAGLPESNQTIGIGYVNGTDSSEGYFLGEVENNEGTFEFKYYPEKLLTTDASLSSDELTLIESLAAGNNPNATISWFSFIYSTSILFWKYRSINISFPQCFLSFENFG